MDHYETMHTCGKHSEFVHVGLMVELEPILTELQPFKLVIFAAFLHCRECSLCNQLFFSVDVSQTLQTYCEYKGDVRVGF